MKKSLFTVMENRQLAPETFLLELRGDTAAITAPGQFVNLALEGKFLRRPLSVCDWAEGHLTLLYKVVGSGTRQLSALGPGSTLDLLTGLGNGYDLSKSGQTPLLIGGGAGIPPLFALARHLQKQGKHPKAILGFRTEADLFFVEEFRNLGVEAVVTTEDGTAGLPGRVTDAMPKEGYSYLYTCGPEPMLRGVWEASVTSGQFSFEERMGCGFGACMGCTCRTKYGAKRICREGPVLEKEEILW